MSEPRDYSSPIAHDDPSYRTLVEIVHTYEGQVLYGFLTVNEHGKLVRVTMPARKAV